MQYPEDLYSSSFPNGVQFTILAKKQTAEANQREGLGGESSALTAEDRESLGNQNRANSENYEQIATESATIGGAAAGWATWKAATGEGASKAIGTVATIASAGAGMALGSNANNQEIVKLSDQISLFIPQSVVTAYTANWDEVDLGPMAGKVGSSGGSLMDLLKAGGETAELIGRGAISAAAQIPAAVGIGDVNLGDLFEATSKKVGNPYKEQLFKSMGFRQFSFQYIFSPKNQTEADTVKSIIETFKMNMHPDVSPDGMFLIYPSEFLIEFQYKGAPNENLPKISNCALKNVKVTYGPDGMFNTFQDAGGMPTETTMELQFVELETLTSKRFRDKDVS